MAWIEKHGRGWRVRYWNSDGTAATVPGTFPTEEEARAHAATLGGIPGPPPAVFLAPQPQTPPPAIPADTPAVQAQPAHPAEAAPTTVAQWIEEWWDTIDIGDNTLAQYRSITKNHILPRWGATPIADITATEVAKWTKQLRENYKPSTVTAIRKLFSLIMADAADNGLRDGNPVRRHRGRGHTHPRTERVWATEQEVNEIARRILTLAGPNQALLIITAAYTGMRWGELAGLRRERCHTGALNPRIVIDPEVGALHEINGQLSYGQPKTARSARTVTLPPFLAALLAAELIRTRAKPVFTTITGKHLRRSGFQRRLWAPAVNGTTFPDGTIWKPIKPGLTFHGLRHSHKTWMIEDGIPDVAQARRLGHRLQDRIDDVYSHVAASVEQRLLGALETRWQRALDGDASTESTPEDGE
ncbi:tyrosine-type recombinase/integrase [Kitasatospora aureofaciens]|uniref:DMT family permease n=3 Tax=Kitasatospora aureofaciens TaxID=1894 RepID=A0A1E7NAS3_KITAU|nr:tyrosine-type recombinase/integrase [Kitasatospora aureofaciens]ARF78075.1 hypothetical protein B6264_03310 [Kitasatospora aureofaciens]OEV37791.1 hypothetical protein HS99_0024685 [Kitasatospora aureofaciens]GGV07631.1 DMT family permease [Kitasatospora aureofaciens]